MHLMKATCCHQLQLWKIQFPSLTFTEKTISAAVATLVACYENKHENSNRTLNTAVSWENSPVYFINIFQGIITEANGSLPSTFNM